MTSVQDVAVLVRYIMSTAVTIPPTITVRAFSIAPTIGGERDDLSLPEVPALIKRYWRALPAHATSCSQPIARQIHHVPRACQAQRRKRALAVHKAHSVAGAKLPAPSFNPASMRSASARTPKSRRGPHRSL